MRAGEVVNSISEPAKHWLDFASIGTLLAVFMSWLPQVATVLTVIWMGLRVYGAVLDNRLRQKALRDERA